MIKVILLVILFVVCAVTKDAKIEPSVSASKNQEYFGSGADHGSHKDDNPEFTDAENRIIQDVFSPDYYEPNIILDYRYLLSGGRGYARSDGGQILILPRRNQMPPPENNYDTLLEYLRLKHLEQISKPFMPNSRLREDYGKIDEGISRESDNRENRGYNGENINMGVNIRDNIWGNRGENIWGNIRANIGGNRRENIWGNIRENVRGNMRDNIGGNMKDNMRGNMRDNMRGNMRDNEMGNMRDNMRGNMRDNEMGNIRDNMRGNMRDNEMGNMRNNMRGNMRDNEMGNIRDNMRGNMRDDRRDSGYRNEKLDRHDIEDRFSSDAELGLALYNH